jgi:hypothetical protein
MTEIERTGTGTARIEAFESGIAPVEAVGVERGIGEIEARAIETPDMRIAEFSMLL